MRRMISLLLGGLFIAVGIAACDDPSGGGGQAPPPQSQPMQ